MYKLLVTLFTIFHVSFKSKIGTKGLSDEVGGRFSDRNYFPEPK